MKRILLPVLVIGVLLLGACGAPTTPSTETPSDEETAPITYTFSVSVNPSGGGSVSPSGGQYEEGTQVTLSATAASGYTFDYWSGDASGSTATISITMDSDKSVVAHFADIAPPVISEAGISHVTESDAIISWVTDEPATSQVEYGQTIAYGSTSALDEELTTSHSLTLIGLTANTTYHFRVKSVDTAGNISMSEDSTFATKIVKELLETWIYSAMTIGDAVHQLGYGLTNGSSQTITVTKVEFFDKNGSIAHTVSESTIQGTSHKGQLLSGHSFNWSLSFSTPYFTEEIEGWTIKWYCLDANGVQFTVEGQYSSSLFP
jgi:uncharacterized repeat protein (TIGR02543 family)